MRTKLSIHSVLLTSACISSSDSGRTSFRSLLTTLLVAISCARGAALASEQSRPNLILIFADDLGRGDLSCFGQREWKTPNLDRMASEGVRLTDFYVSVPYCAPSRAALLTGRHPFRSGVTGNPAPDGGIHGFGMDARERTIAEALRDRGYATSCIGKWHLGHLPRFYPRAHGFDEYVGILYSNDMRPVVLVENELAIEYPVIQSTLTARSTDRALEFIDKNRETPFFLYLPYAMPHKPLAASENFYTPETPGDLYADVIRELDAAIGRILAKLSELELDKRTLVVFTSDNGPWFGGSTGGLRGMKGSTWEGGIRVPFIARWPGRLPAGAIRREPCASIDVFPTFAALAGAPADRARPFDGVDIMPLLEHDAAPDARPLYSFLGRKVCTIREGRWKLHVTRPSQRPRWTSEKRWKDPRGPDGVTILGPFEQPQPTEYPSPPGGVEARAGLLFDLESDPREQLDVSAEHPAVSLNLLAKARLLQEELSASPASPARGPKISRGPLQVSAVDPLPIEALLPPSVIEPRSPAPRELYEKLDSDRWLGEAKVVATVKDELVFTEGPAVDRDGRVWFTNIPVSKILRFDPATSTLEVVRESSNQANGLLFTPDGALLACEGGAGRVTRIDPRSGETRVLADSYRGYPFAPPNDLCLDSRGRLYFTSRPGVKDPEKGNLNAVYRLDPDGAVTQLLAWPRVHMPNGIVLSPDERTLYLIEAHPDEGHHRDIRAFDLEPDGSITNERVLIDFYPGRSGDGMCIDTEGNLYVAAGLHAMRGTSETLDTRPGIHVISPRGELLAFRETPEDTVTNCSFGSADLKTLYVTCGTRLLAIRTRVTGNASGLTAR